MRVQVETGFVNVEAARRAMRRIRLRRRLQEIDALVAALLDRLDHAGDPPRNPVVGASELAGGDPDGGIGRRGVDLVEGEDVREDDLLQGTDLVLQFLQALCDGIGHGRFSVVDSPEGIAAAGRVHRQSTGAK